MNRSSARSQHSTRVPVSHHRHTGLSLASNANGNGSHHHNHTRREEHDFDGWKFLHVGWRVLAIGLTMLCLIGMTIFLSILYIFVRPFSKRAYRRLACTVGAASFLDAVAILMPNVKLCLTGDSDVPSAIGTSVLVSNHVMEGDWWMMLMLSRCIGLRGTVKVFLPNELSSISSPASSAYDLTKHMGVAANITPATASAAIDPQTGPLRTWVTFLLRTLLEFPSLSVESGSDYIKGRSDLFHLLRDFAEEETSCPVQLLLLPEGWPTAVISDAMNVSGLQWNAQEIALRRKLLLAKSVEFAKREGRPQLRHLILPRTTGFNACLECLRASNPEVYDVTIAYQGYDGLVPISVFNLTFPSLWHLTEYRMPKEVHVRINRYSMKEVLQDANFLDRIWAEKDRSLAHFQRHQNFPSDSRGFCKVRVFHTRWHSVENSLMGLARLAWIPFCIPLLILFSIPVGVTVFWLWAWYKLFSSLFPIFFEFDRDTAGGRSGASHHGRDAQNDDAGSEDYGGGDRGGEQTPFIPATPFASPMFPPSSFAS